MINDYRKHLTIKDNQIDELEQKVKQIDIDISTVGSDFDKLNQLVVLREELEKEINKQGIKYPDIVMAQAKIESGHFTSAIFKENNNLFGMKLPAQRKTTAIGKNRGHAKYETWQDSVKDYKIWQDTLGWSSLSKETYIQKLSDKYCMPPDCPKGYYSKIVKKTMASG